MKAWFKSKGVWAGVLTVVFGVYAVIQGQFNLPDITSFLPFIFALLGAFGIYGRVQADGKIVFKDTEGSK